ncbi:MAG: hypothetical protein NT067_01490 [Candidatus Diapherotrites archaeon]|nr:hypothetical protein [Candidatus Diapherotrites archaeon]
MFREEKGMLQCCSIEGIPSLEFAKTALENALSGRKICKEKTAKKSLLFLLWLYCTGQLEKAIEQAGRTEKGCLLVIASKNKKTLKQALAVAKEHGFKEKKGLIQQNFSKNQDAFVKRFCISKKELHAFRHLPRKEAIERLILERQAMMAL